MQFNQLALKPVDTSGQGGQVRGKSSFLVGLLLLVVRGHGNYLPLSLPEWYRTLSIDTLCAEEEFSMALRVLVIDDDDLSREVFALMLNSAGYAVETADSGDAALSYLQAGGLKPEVVLTDLQMPGTTGSELARRLRALCGLATKVFAMSASVPDEETDDAFDCLLLKPFTAEIFAAAVARASPPATKKSAAPTGTRCIKPVWIKPAWITPSTISLLRQ